MQRRHSMPFGTEVRDGEVRFRLWAPAAKEVTLEVVEARGDRPIPMTRLTDGWFEMATGAAAPGTRYRYRIDNGMAVPDPASRYNPGDVHGLSEVIDPAAFVWHDAGWQGRSWEEAVIYELHVGAFTAAGSFLALIDRLDYLVRLGVTAIELMPLADFPGARNWGYDGTLLYAPDSSYGRPEDLKALIDAAHGKGLMVFLDVVYNHFGPEGNYLHAYAPQFFTEHHHTPWGTAINFDTAGSGVVRDFFVHNALYWLEEFHFDGLRLDAVHAIVDDSRPHILIDLAEAVRAGPGRERHIHLLLENDHNIARCLERDAAGRPRWYTAQWNDDIHHAMHVLATGEADGYYADYADQPVAHLGRCLAEGFAYQGEPSPFRNAEQRGEPSAHLPPTAFISFLQNHDQVGNRAFGERLSAVADPAALRALTAIMLLAPSPPLLFMGEEFAAPQPFPFFCNFEPALAAAVTDGRRREFAGFDKFSDRALSEQIPDPSDAATFVRSKLDWQDIRRPPHDEILELYRGLLTLRANFIIPRLADLSSGDYQLFGNCGLRVQWPLSDASRLTLLANLGTDPLIGIERPTGELIYATDVTYTVALKGDLLPPWTVAWFIDADAAMAATGATAAQVAA